MIWQWYNNSYIIQYRCRCNRTHGYRHIYSTNEADAITCFLEETAKCPWCNKLYAKCGDKYMTFVDSCGFWVLREYDPDTRFWSTLWKGIKKFFSIKKLSGKKLFHKLFHKK